MSSTGQADTSLLEVLNGSLANTAWRKEVYIEFMVLMFVVLML
jgi:hypothetical protein